MSSNYYSMCDGKLKIAEALMGRGWTVYGYRSSYMDDDPGSDYPFHQGNWNGIATKNGFILVVDIDNASEATEIKKYNYNNTSYSDREKISKLEAMTQENGCTAGEEQNAKELIKKINDKESEGVVGYEVIGVIPAHMGNPGKCKWHIEKDGKIYDKGTGITKYADLLPDWEYDINKMEYKEGYTHWRGYGNEAPEKKILPEETRKVINDFKNLILRFERIASGINPMGDGTAETEQAGTEAQTKIGYEKVTVKETKTGLKMVEVTDRKYIIVGDYITTDHYSCYWKVIREGMRTGTWKGVKMEKNTFTYEQVGKESRGYQELKNGQRYYNYEERILKDIENGTTKIYELKEVTEVIEVEKWVKIDKSKKTTYNTKTENKQEEKTKQTEETITTESNNIINHEITITADTDTRDNSALWVVKLVNKVDYEEFCRIRDNIIKPIKGNYSKFKSGFIFKYDPTSILKCEIEEQEEQEEQPEINNVIDFEEYKNNNEVEEVENNNNSFDDDDILSKFDDVKINNNSRISASDEEFCKNKEGEYKQFIEFSNNYIQYLENNILKNSMFDSQSLINEMNKKRDNKKCWFTNNIVDYFRTTYKITLTAEPIHKKYDIKIDYNTIVSDIIEQLGGYNFIDKAEKEIKDACKAAFRQENIKIKNNKITIDSFFYIDYFSKRYNDYEVSYNSDDNFHKLFKAFSHFIFRANESYFNTLYHTITREKNDNVFKTHLIANNGVKTLKLYKNGKIDIEFSSAEYARQFAKEYCGYMEKSA